MNMPQANQPHMLIVEGNIGAGKSTFLRIVGERLATEVVYEPHEQWQSIGGENLLDKFYADTKRWAYSFQTYAFVTRVLQQEQYARQARCAVQVYERSVYSDRYCFAKNCYQMGTMTALEWKLYQEWFSWLVDSYTIRPHGFIYLRTDPRICFERLTKRNRSEEQQVERAYIERLHEKHEAWLIEKKEVADFIKDVPVLVLECDADFEHDRAQQDVHMQKIVDFFGVQHKIHTSEAKSVSASL